MFVELLYDTQNNINERNGTIEGGMKHNFANYVFLCELDNLDIILLATSNRLNLANIYMKTKFLKKYNSNTLSKTTFYKGLYSTFAAEDGYFQKHLILPEF